MGRRPRQRLVGAGTPGRSRVAPRTALIPLAAQHLVYVQVKVAVPQPGSGPAQRLSLRSQWQLRVDSDIRSSAVWAGWAGRVNDKTLLISGYEVYLRGCSRVRRADLPVFW